MLVGVGGDDVLRGGAGDDVLIGGRGVDVLIGGRGDDQKYATEMPEQHISINYDSSLPDGTTIEWNVITACVDVDDRPWKDELPGDSGGVIDWTPHADGCSRVRADIVLAAHITIGKSDPMPLDVKAIYYFAGSGSLACTPLNPRLACVADLTVDGSGSVTISLK